MTRSTSRRVILCSIASLWLIACVSGAVAQPADTMQAQFASPPDSAKPHTWWHWMNGNITREGITRDIEEMKRVGLGGAQIFDVTDGIPPGPVKYMSDEWRAMIKHAVQEANRVGLELCMHNCAGWSSSGGPWITPELAMQMLTVTETRITGPAKVDQVLAQPPTRSDYYRDIAVLAFPTPGVEARSMRDAQPAVTASVDDFDGSRLVDGDPGTFSSLAVRGREETQHIQFEFAEPFTAQALTLIAVGGRETLRGVLQVSDDGEEFRKVTDFAVGEPTVLRPPTTVSFEPVAGRFFRMVFSRRALRSSRVALAEVNLEAGLRIRNWAGKAGFTRSNPPLLDRRETPEGAAIPRAGIVNLTAQMDADGRLTWDAPAGDWTVMRFGHTPTAKTNHPASVEGIGLECDKLSRKAADAHFAGMLDQVIADVGPLAGTTLKHALIDSYEVDCQNWTPQFRQEFEKRRGYDPLPYMPAVTGRVVESVAVTERFLWDMRRTIADLFADNYFGYFAEKLAKHDMLLSTEAYGNGGFDNLTCAGRAEIPMSEFWAGSGNSNAGSKEAASVAHTYGRKFVGAESFTADPQAGGWRNHPWSMKTLGDLIYCGGVNRFIFHRYAHQPWPSLKPGMTMGPHGFHFEHTNTWWEQAPAWTTYLARCQYLLQEGLFVGDLCYFVGEDSPNSLSGKAYLHPSPPEGYDFDGCDTQVLLTRMSVEDGRIVLPDGMSYRVLVLPDRDTMTPTVLRKIRQLISDGATVYGPRPVSSPSLDGYPGCDENVQTLAQEIWGDCDGEVVTRHTLGKGQIIWGEPMDAVLGGMGLQPDFEYKGTRPQTLVQWIHRNINGADTYFVSNQNRRSEVVDCTFRVSGKAPELWHPDTGAVERAPIFREENGRTVVTLQFDPGGSAFVVFREPAPAGDHVVSATVNGRSALLPEATAEADLQITKAIYGVLSAELPEAVDVTRQLRQMVRDASLVVRATNSIAGDPASNIVKQLWVDYSLDGQRATKTVDENQVLSITPEAEGEHTLLIHSAIYGIIPEQPGKQAESLTVDVTEQLTAMIEGGALSAIATNAIAGDPAPLIVKEMRVDYLLDGRPFSSTVGENQLLELPTGTEGGPSAVRIPAAELAMTDGGTVMTAWLPGEFELTTSQGRKLTRTVADIPEPIEITGPWNVSFPPGWNAPESTVFDELISWPESDEPGVKYFSGTATYSRQINVPAELLAPGQVCLLDLGVVKEIAQVRLNGQDLGILWKPPFRLDVSKIARPGQNTLEVKVTNLWPNRLIGDEFLADDAEWSGPALKQVPEWLAEGGPRPATGRLTFTTWKHYTKESPLLESGLLGPVVLRAGRLVKLQGI